jgi:hypothetical protein
MPPGLAEKLYAPAVLQAAKTMPKTGGGDPQRDPGSDRKLLNRAMRAAGVASTPHATEKENTWDRASTNPAK